MLPSEGVHFRVWASRRHQVEVVLGCHVLTSPGRYKALTALLLLGPGTPMLFQGQEFAASSPFFFFADFTGELGRLTCQGRAAFLSQFPSLAQPNMPAYLSDPTDSETFAGSKLDLSERQYHAAMYALHRDLLRLRHDEAGISVPAPWRYGRGGARGRSVCVALLWGAWGRSPASSESRTGPAPKSGARTVAGSTSGYGLDDSVVH